MDLLEVKKISKTYGTGEGTVHALKKAAFSVPKGEFVAIVGESGSGKSTLLNMIGALDTPASGKVFIGGKDMVSMKERNLTVLGLKERRNHLPSQLSGGQQQRVAIGPALITRSQSIAQTADRILQVSDGVVTDFGRCKE
ncbi:MAG: ABC transporter ATP-binding protein [Ruminococcus sp.]|jgi:putative ABC transport system ATP-binding protein